MENLENKSQEELNEEKPKYVNWFMNRSRLNKREGKNGEFYQARVFEGSKLKDGTDISNYTYTFNVEKLKEITAHENSPDFIKDEKFRENNGVIYFKEETKIKLTEPYDKENPDKELKVITVDAKDLSTALKNRERPAKAKKKSAIDRAKGVSSPKHAKTERNIDVR